MTNSKEQDHSKEAKNSSASQ